MKNRLMERRSLWPTVITRDNDNHLASSDRIFELAERDALRDKMRAGLCKQAMDNTALLAMAEEQLSAMAPTAKAEYRMIVQSYTAKALAEIIGGDW